MGPHDWLIQLGHYQTGWEHATKVTAWTAKEAAEEFIRSRHATFGYPNSKQVSVRPDWGGEVEFFTVFAMATDYRFLAHSNS